MHRPNAELRTIVTFVPHSDREESRELVMIGNIIVHVDGSASSERAVDTAGVLAVRCGAALAVVYVSPRGEMPSALKAAAQAEHVTEHRTPAMSLIAGIPSWMHDALDAIANAADERLAKELIASRVLDAAQGRLEQAGVEASYRVAHAADAADGVLGAAEDIGAELIVVGARALGEGPGAHPGAVADEVLERASCAVLVVK
jgi:nucleotide-binding universal stress UspA family protein